MSYPKTENGKTIFFESKWKSIIAATICWFFTVIALTLSDKKEEPLMFWMTLTLFGSGALFMTFRLLNPKYKFIKPGSKEFKEYAEKEFQVKYNDLGIFTYTEGKFSVEFDEGIKSFEWNKIKTLIGYNIDNFAYDIIALQIIFEDHFKFRVTEETNGWFQFLIRLKTQIPEIPSSWEITISTPAFEKNLTVVFDRLNRNLEQVIKEEYEQELNDPDKNAEVTSTSHT